MLPGKKHKTGNTKDRKRERAALVFCEIKIDNAKKPFDLTVEMFDLASNQDPSAAPARLPAPFHH